MILKKTFISIGVFLILLAVIISSFFLYEEISPLLLEKNVNKKIQEFAPTVLNDSIVQTENLSYYTELPNFTALSKENSDTIAWLQVPNTEISYPIVQGQNNSIYLQKDFLKNKSQYGTPFLDFSVSSDFSSKLNIIYAHNIPNTHLMFTDMEYFLNSTFCNENSNFYLYTPNSNNIANIFAVLVVDENSELYNENSYTNYNISTTKSFLMENSIFFSESSFPNQQDNSIIALSTCFKEENAKFGNKRILILATI